MKNLSLTLLALLFSGVIFAQAPGPITGAPSACVGIPSGYSDPVGGGTWSTSNVVIATIDLVSGTLNGLSTGVVVVSYTTIGGTAIATVSINPTPAPITGATAECAGSTTLQSDGTAGGVWSTSSPVTATINTIGYLTGVSAGTVNVYYSFPTGCAVGTTVTINPLPVPFNVSGGGPYCAGSPGVHVGLSGSQSGTSYTLYNGGASVATLTGTGGAIDFGLQPAGTYTATATNGGCTSSMTGSTTVAVNPLPSSYPVIGGGTFCSGGTGVHIGLAVSEVGISYQLYNGAVPISFPLFGTGTAIDFGLLTTGGTYTVVGTNATTACTNAMVGVDTITILATPGAILGSAITCTGTAISLTDATSGGTWSSAYPGIAAVGSTGTVTGGTPGTSAISYTLSSGCSASVIVTVNTPPSALGGLSTVCVGSSIGISESIPGGTWSSSSTTVATVNSSGVAYGVNAGAVNIYYTLSPGCSAGKTITVNPLPSALPLTAVCVGVTTLFTNSIPGGTWSSSAPAIATINPVSGSAYGISPGSTIINYTVSTGCSVNGTLNVALAPGPITGTSIVCVGASIALGNLVAGGSWSSSDAAVATVNSSGVAYGVTAGAANIYYTLGSGCVVAKTISVNPAPPAITGPGSVCAGSNVTLSDPATGGGTWGSMNMSIATAGSGSGVIYGEAAGNTLISFTSTTTGCSTSMTVTVNPLPATIGGSGSICSGSFTPLNDSTGGGTWSSGNPAIATMETFTGVLWGASAGTATISYTLPTGCSITSSEIIYPLPGVISGASSVCASQTISLTDGTPGGAWSSSAPTIATVNPSGTVTGVTGGTVIIDYTSTSGCVSTTTITVNSLPTAYHIAGGGSYCSGTGGVAVGLDGSSTGVNYQFYLGGSALGSTIPGTASSLSLGLETAAGVYTAVATNSTTGCFTNMSGSTTISISSLPTVHTVDGGGAYCSGGSGVHVYLDGSELGIGYQLYNGITPFGAVVSGMGSPIDFGYLLLPGVYTVMAINLVTGCSIAMTGTAPVTVSALPTIYTVTGGGPYCDGGAGVHVGLSGSNAGNNYQLYTGGIPVGMPVAGTGSAVDFGSIASAGTYIAAATDATTGCASAMASSAIVVINPLPALISGSLTGCLGITSSLTDATSGGAWSSSNPAVATINSASGMMTGLSAGAANIYYTLGTGCATAVTVSVSPTTPSAVSISTSTGTTVCGGTMVVYTAVPVGGGATPSYNWMVDGVAVATASSYAYVPSDGDLVGLWMTSSITCAVPATPFSSVTMTVNPMPAAISGPTSICIGSTITLTDAVAGGTWTENTGVTIVGTIGGSTGVVTALYTGIDTISYTMAGGCFADLIVTVSAAPTISATSTPSCGGSYTLTASGATSYTWSPSAGLSCSNCASTTIDPTATVNYTVTGTNAGGCADTAYMTVNGNRINGHITIGAAGTIQVWLVKFNPADSSIVALDSTTACSTGGAPYFEFNSPASGSYMVKAYLTGGTPGTSGYIPTYGLSSAHWDSAATVTHTSASDSLHIDMIYGTVPVGPGFIGGFVASGAGKGTTGTVPAQGMLIYLIDAGTNKIVTYTYTDATGNYAFSGLGDGHYIIYPEDYQYITTPSSVININSTYEMANGINFRQHTMSRTIVPYLVTEVRSVLSTQGLSVYPNPTQGDLNIKWDNQETGNASLVINDVTGKEVYKTVLNINDKTGEAKIGLRELKNGIYLFTIKNEHLNYCGKIVIEQ